MNTRNCSGEFSCISLEEFIEKNHDDEWLYYKLTDFIDEMPLDRKHCEELIEASESYYLLELFEGLYYRYRDYLTSEEYHTLKKNFNRIFDFGTNLFCDDF